ncbi:hypothetical protein [Vibrio tapetis]|uniref:HEPN domain-containing protein n=1 Tax=Vibrio tapetis subsp. tapetis TaxID=1671868 RepID=A0A2N8ZI34_9VIBR|nr:hypothetical protein [Vibrio tapetis]SON51572.1 conserved protein of unknown function [Vibrio tapetis subsp. tapetis]
MKYPEYLLAAKRHSETCKVLQERIEACLSADQEQSLQFQNLVLSLYYLSGYIVECSLKYKILDLLGFDININVDKSGCNGSGIIKYNEIATHKFDDLQNRLSSLISDLTYESNNSQIEQLLINWDPSIRYKDIDLPYSDVKDFYLHTRSFLRNM